MVVCRWLGCEFVGMEFWIFGAFEISPRFKYCSRPPTAESQVSLADVESAG